MKRIIAIAAFLLCILLVAYAAPAMEAARNAVDIWWNTLLPTLFPFFACATLMERSGALHRVASLMAPLSKKLKISNYALPLLFLGGMSGYPSGARLCGILQKADCIGVEEAERLATVCNLASPMFIAGALASGMLGDSTLFMPLAVGHYGGALLTAILLHIFSPVKNAKVNYLRPTAIEPLHKMLPKTLSDGMADITKVGGSVIFFLVLAEILKQVGAIAVIGAPIDALFANIPGESPSQGILLGLFEMTGGCHLIAEAGLPRYATIPLCTFLVSFGGLSIMVQALAFVQFKKPWKYILTKLMHAGIAACISYAIVINQPGAVAAFNPNAAAYAQNAISGLTTLFACSLGVGAAFLIALLAGRPRRERS